MQGLIIALDGLPGVGKTTFGEALTAYLNSDSNTEKAIFLSEYVNEVLLQLYLSDMNKYSLMFQLAMLKEKAKTYELAAFYASQGKTVIIDRSHIGDLSFALLQKKKCSWSDTEFAAYISCFDEMIPPHIILYLQADEETAYQRMLKRKRPGEEAAYSKEYYTILNQVQERELFSRTNRDDSVSEGENVACKLLVVDWNEELNEISTDCCCNLMTTITSR